MPGQGRDVAATLGKRVLMDHVASGERVQEAFGEGALPRELLEGVGVGGDEADVHAVVRGLLVSGGDQMCRLPEARWRNITMNG